ncbi:MAG: type II toxin-antitoxin system PemK/MazF family toxin [Deltaproteobacteria bacterium]|nr:type II toxin-antitoxin system PemK/MazF family toxin [Deltaproteobacteria bacterium]
MRTGDIYWVNLDPAIGDEIQKKRPVVFLNGGHEKHLRLAIVAPITSWNPAWERNPFFVPLEPTAKNGLKKKSVIDCFQVRAISHRRFLERLGVIALDDISRVKKSLALILDLDPEDCE